MAPKAEKMPVGKYISLSIITVLIIPAIIMWLSGNWRWVEGWIFSLWFDAMLLYNSIYLYTKDPALLAERMKRPGSDNQKGWDRAVQIGVLIMGLVWLIILPLDASRFGWSPAFPVWLKVIGGAALIPAIYLIERATIENTFLSTMVRIQDERKQHVISTGVYGFVRHPLYLGCLLMLIGGPLLVGSLCGLIIAFIGLIGLVGRITGEEKMLAEELAGYEEYRQKVKFRLIPLIW
jgi:protein-S-isoprenylcysteine O-methyltransferase Ste14